MIDRRSLITAAAACAALSPLASTARAAEPKMVTARFLLLRNQALVPVTIGDHPPLRFAIDTGDEAHCSLNPKIAAAYGLKPSGETHLAGLVGDDFLPYYRADNVVIAGVLRQESVYFDGIDLGDEVDGILPARLFKTQDTDIDFTRGEFRLHFGTTPDRTGFMPISYNPGRSGDALIVRCVLDDRPVRLQLDTGFPGAVSLDARYVRENQLWNTYPHFMAQRVVGVTGGAAGRVVRGKSLLFGPVRFHDPIVNLLDPERAANFKGEVDGLIGMDVIRRFDLSIQNFPRPTLWLKQNQALSDPFAVDRSGLTLGRGSKGLAVVVAVAKGSAGEAAGLQPGDRIPAIDSEELLRDLKWRLSDGAGVVIALEVRRKGEMLPVKITLADRI